jgi:hypothetical protein
MPSALRLAGVAAWLVVTPIIGCSSSTSTPPGPGDGGVASADASAPEVADATVGDSADASEAAACPLPGKLGSPLCEACISAHCCAEVRACVDDPACSTILSCVQACLLAPNAAPCIEKCIADTPGGSARYMAFDACVAAVPPQGCAIDCSQ